MPQADKRHIKSLAAREGLTLRQVIEQSFRVWESQLAVGRAKPHPAQQAATAADSAKPDRPKPPAAPTQARPPVSQSPSAPKSSVPTSGRPARAPDWLRRAGQLDWSKCPEAECLQSKTRSVWVARGTMAPLAHIFDAVAGGNPVEEIAEVYELSLQQLVAIVRFAVVSTAQPAAGMERR